MDSRAFSHYRGNRSPRRGRLNTTGQFSATLSVFFASTRGSELSASASHPDSSCRLSLLPGRGEHTALRSLSGHFQYPMQDGPRLCRLSRTKSRAYFWKAPVLKCSSVSRYRVLSSYGKMGTTRGWSLRRRNGCIIGSKGRLSTRIMAANDPRLRM